MLVNFGKNISEMCFQGPVARPVAPVAQLVERWTLGSESPGSRRSGARYIKLLTGMARLVGAAAAS